MNPKIIGIDTGTSETGYVILHGNFKNRKIMIQDFGRVRTRKTDGTVRERIDYIGNELIKVITDNRITHVAIEDYTEQGRGTGKIYKEMSWLTAHLRAIIQEKGFPLSIYENRQWKKKVLGIHSASKKQVQHRIRHKLPESNLILQKQPTHVWDGAGIGYCQWLEIMEKL